MKALNLNLFPFRRSRIGLPYLVDFFKKTKANISKEAHIDESIIYDWLNGRSTPSLESIIALADYFDCSVEFILGREN